MSNAVLPSFPGLTWNVVRRPKWSTITKTSVSGREFRAAQYSYPIWQYKLTYEVLRARSALQEMQQLAAFFNARQGSFDTFLYTDPDDNTVSSQPFGVGDGTTTQFQLVRSFGGYTEPVFDLNGSWDITVNGYGGVARINLLKYSQSIGNAVWGKANCTVTDNAVAAPDGTTTASQVNRTATGNHYVNQVYSVTDHANTTFTFSCWLKLGTMTGTVTLRLRDGGGTEIAAFAATATSSWQRFSVSGTFGASPAANINVFVDPGNDVGAAGDTFFVWGAQLETGAAPSVGYITTTANVFNRGVANGLVTFSAAPASGAALTWTGAYYWRCRFLQDQAEFNQFMKQLWELKTLEFTTVKP